MGQWPGRREEQLKAGETREPRELLAPVAPDAELTWQSLVALSSGFHVAQHVKRDGLQACARRCRKMRGGQVPTASAAAQQHHTNTHAHQWGTAGRLDLSWAMTAAARGRSCCEGPEAPRTQLGPWRARWWPWRRNGRELERRRALGGCEAADGIAELNGA